MTVSNQPATRQPRREAATHLFEIGQAVHLKKSFASMGPADEVYLVTARLPPRGDSFQYRIRNEAERHERVTTQDSLEPVRQTRAEDGKTLIERTFGHGQGTEAQQSRDQETQAGEGPEQA